MFVCLWVCLFFVLIILGHQQVGSLKILWRSNLIWLRYLGSKNVYLFFCLFIDLFVFYFNHSETPTGSYPVNFVKIPLDLADILRIRKTDWKMFICLFVCLFVYIFICFLLKSSWNTQRKFPSKFRKDQTWFGWDIDRTKKINWCDGGEEKGKGRP